MSNIYQGNDFLKAQQSSNQYGAVQDKDPEQNLDNYSDSTSDTFCSKFWTTWNIIIVVFVALLVLLLMILMIVYK